jgi:hypothetical protein
VLLSRGKNNIYIGLYHVGREIFDLATIPLFSGFGVSNTCVGVSNIGVGVSNISVGVSNISVGV